MARRIIGIHEKLPLLESLPLSFQHLTAMFGATILVPILLGVDPAIALLMNGVGTLVYTWITKGGIPADKVTTYSQKMFLPFYLLNSMASAPVVKDGVRVPFVLPKTTLFEAKRIPSGFSLSSPAT